MNLFSVYMPISNELLKTIALRDGGKAVPRPKEDFFLTSNKYPIYVVADGVTLIPNERGNYPNPSGAGAIAKIFCESVISAAEKAYENFSEIALVDVFREGNQAAYEYNASEGRTKETVDYWQHDLFAATTAFGLIKENKLYWWSLCDAGVSIFNDRDERTFTSPPCWSEKSRKKNLPQDWEKVPLIERKKILWQKYRNGVNEQGEVIGYGVVTGEETAERYLNRGTVELTEDDLVTIYTDGYENYLNLAEFISSLRNSNNLDTFDKLSVNPEQSRRIDPFEKEKIAESPEKFGQERTLIAVIV
ncbi:MAG: protein phosphatase 2C domain-containing protein [bacterium]|nr:protein phosphatase 2C domain-containing protein [bacterium]